MRGSVLVLCVAFVSALAVGCGDDPLDPPPSIETSGTYPSGQGSGGEANRPPKGETGASDPSSGGASSEFAPVVENDGIGGGASNGASNGAAGGGSSSDGVKSRETGGNNGLGNGQDPAPPGDKGSPNDGSGSEPGSPGSKGGKP